MSRFVSFRRLFVLLFLFSFGSMLAHAQFRASLRGTVTDQQGAAVPGATVTLINTATNQKMVSTSDANGIYQFNALGPAPYSLAAEHAGFKKRMLDNVQIIPEQLNSLDLQLEVGEVAETVTVSGTTQTLDTETATVSGTVSAAIKFSICRRLTAISFNWRSSLRERSGMLPNIKGEARPQLRGIKDLAELPAVRAESSQLKMVPRYRAPVGNTRPIASISMESAQ